MRVLIVDDSRVMRMIVARALRQSGYGSAQVVEASNGREGFEAVRDHGPDLVLCDWNMPEMSGIELLRALTAAGSPVRFGFVTSEGSEEMRQRAEDAGAAFLIAKPFDADLFAEALQEIGL